MRESEARASERELSLPGSRVKISYAFVIDFEISDIRSGLARAHSTRALECASAKCNECETAVCSAPEKDRFLRIFLTLGYGRNDTSAYIIAPKSSSRTSRMSPERSATDKKFVDAIAPPRQPVFTAIKRVHANIRHPPFHGGKVGKISPYVVRMW